MRLTSLILTSESACPGASVLALGYQIFMWRVAANPEQEDPTERKSQAAG